MAELGARSVARYRIHLYRVGIQVHDGIDAIGERECLAAVERELLGVDLDLVANGVIVHVLFVDDVAIGVLARHVVLDEVVLALHGNLVGRREVLVESVTNVNLVLEDFLAREGAGDLVPLVAAELGFLGYGVGVLRETQADVHDLTTNNLIAVLLGRTTIRLILVVKSFRTE